jgi:hypothetical protein
MSKLIIILACFLLLPFVCSFKDLQVWCLSDFVRENVINIFLIPTELKCYVSTHVCIVPEKWKRGGRG